VVRMNANSLPDTLSKAVVEMSELMREPELNQGTAMWESRARCGIVKGEMFREADLTTYVLSDLGLDSERSRLRTYSRVRASNFPAPRFAKTPGLTCRTFRGARNQTRQEGVLHSAQPC
jgi:hypothetical protein